MSVVMMMVFVVMAMSAALLSSANVLSVRAAKSAEVAEERTRREMFINWIWRSVYGASKEEAYIAERFENTIFVFNRID